MNEPPLIDPFARAITYLRVSVTDRCDLRCTYCMSERMSFLPKAELLTFEELDRLCSAFIALGVRKLRLTGGEPLVRRDFIDLVRGLSRHLRTGALDDLTLTTNATQLRHQAAALAQAGIKRINISLDTLDRETFARITRRDQFDEVMAGIHAAQAAGLKIKINTVALARDNKAELPHMIAWAHQQDFDITLIETMPMGDVAGDRSDQYLSLKEVRRDLESYWSLQDVPDRTGGPARYVRIAETGGRLGFITPLSHNFCEACNRVRLTCTGVLYLCLGQDDAVDLREVLRSGADDTTLKSAIRAAMTHKPRGHDFDAARLAQPALKRHMSVTGG
jgi:cyclic pyranopterin phosphate synthase